MKYIVLILLFCTPASAAITANLVTSRTGGPAPLYVFFDLTSTTHTDPDIVPWRDLLFSCNFGDNTSGTWDVDGKTRNSSFGSTAAHVFNNHGNYTVECIVTDHKGSTSTVSVLIAVQDPDIYWAGDLTVCVSTSGTFAECPDGATEETSSDADAMLATYTGSKRRLLFRRGETFNSDTLTTIENQGEGLIGAYGSGDRPIIPVAPGTHFIDLGALSIDPLRWAENWRIMDIDSSGGNYLIVFRAPTTSILIQNIKLRDTARGGILMHRGRASVNDDVMHDQVAFIDLDLSNLGIVLPLDVNLKINSRQMALMGSDIDAHDAIGATVWFQFIDRGVVQHNLLNGQIDDSPVIRFASCEWVEVDSPCDGEYSEYAVISDNTLVGGGGGPNIVEMGPGVDEDQRIRYVTFERNYLTGGSAVEVGIQAWISDSIVRETVIDMSNSTLFAGVIFQLRPTTTNPPDVTGNWAVNITCFASDTSATFDCLDWSADALADSVAQNTFIYAPNITTPDVIGTAPETRSGNRTEVDNPFITAPSNPVNIEDFQLNEKLPNTSYSISYLGYRGVRRFDRSEVGAYTLGLPVLKVSGSVDLIHPWED